MKVAKSILIVALLLFPFKMTQAQDLGISWIEVKGGFFTMGSGSSARQVSIGSFQMSATEVTFDQYDAYCREIGVQMPDDNGWGRGKRPVFYVSYDDALGFCRWLGKKLGAKIHLPNEAEWEHAAIGGNKSMGFVYSGSNNWEEVSWSEGNSAGRTWPAGGKKANELGLYDMSGNVWEWCAGWPDNGESNSRSDNKRCLRGNSFDNPASNIRHPAVCIEGDARHYNIGFRIVKK